MKKINYKILLFSTLICLSPIIIGVYLYNQLPANMPSHWNINGQVDGYLPKNIAVFLVPALMAAINGLVIVATQLDPKRISNPDKIVNKIYWLVPILSVFISVITYRVALGHEVDVGTFVVAFVGILFMVIGNYLPKIKQNYTIGIKIPWTLNNEEVWFKTHRLAGTIWFGGGFVILIAAFISGFVATVAVGLFIFAGIVIPTIYSYHTYKSIEKDKL